MFPLRCSFAVFASHPGERGYCFLFIGRPWWGCHNSTDKEPTFKSNLLVFEGRYSLIGEEHKKFTADKMADSGYYVLTLAAVGRELNIRKQASARWEDILDCRGKRTSQNG